MREASSSHDRKGLSLIGDLYILIGLAIFLAGVFILWTINPIGFVYIVLGFTLASVGHYLDDLKPWAWWGAFLGNFCSGGAISLAISGSPLEVTTSLFYYLVEVSLTVAIFVYLLQPSVKSLFFVSENK